jgi:hypothetical protein
MTEVPYRAPPTAADPPKTIRHRSFLLPILALLAGLPTVASDFPFRHPMTDAIVLAFVVAAIYLFGRSVAVVVDKTAKTVTVLRPGILYGIERFSASIGDVGETQVETKAGRGLTFTNRGIAYDPDKYRVVLLMNGNPVPLTRSFSTRQGPKLRLAERIDQAIAELRR